jgi:hypothetical protein
MRPAINLAPSNVTGTLASVTEGATPPSESTSGRAIAATCGYAARASAARCAAFRDHA